MALSRALNELKHGDDYDAGTFNNLKSQRDVLNRSLASGEIWASTAVH